MPASVATTAMESTAAAKPAAFMKSMITAVETATAMESMITAVETATAMESMITAVESATAMESTVAAEAYMLKLAVAATTPDYKDAHVKARQALESSSIEGGQ